MFRAKISPKPSMMPLMNGRRKLIASEEVRARRRVLVVAEGEKMERVAEGGCGTGAGAGISSFLNVDADGLLPSGWERVGEGGWVEKEISGKEDSRERVLILSHESGEWLEEG